MFQFLWLKFINSNIIFFFRDDQYLDIKAEKKLTWLKSKLYLVIIGTIKLISKTKIFYTCTVFLTN